MLAYGRSSTSSRSGRSSREDGRIAFPSMSTSPPSRHPPPSRSVSSASSYSTATRIASKSTGAIDRALETLFEDETLSPASPTATSFSDPRGAAPRRSHTTPAVSSLRKQKERPNAIRHCVKCEKRIEDGRWIQSEGAAVLCEGCWKNMYLPKVSMSYELLQFCILMYSVSLVPAM